MQDDKIKVNIQSSKESYSLELPKKSTIEDLKAKIYEVKGIPIKSQNIRHNDENVSDYSKIADFKDYSFKLAIIISTSESVDEEKNIYTKPKSNQNQKACPEIFDFLAKMGLSYDFLKSNSLLLTMSSASLIKIILCSLYSYKLGKEEYKNVNLNLKFKNEIQEIKMNKELEISNENNILKILIINEGDVKKSIQFIDEIRLYHIDPNDEGSFICNVIQSKKEEEIKPVVQPQPRPEEKKENVYEELLHELKNMGFDKSDSELMELLVNANGNIDRVCDVLFGN